MPEPVQAIGTVVKWEAENVIFMRVIKMGNDGTAFQETETGREEADNLMYEIESANRQLSSLQGILAAKNKEVVSLHAQLIERDVLLKQAAVCISEAISLCRQQADHTKEAHNFLKDYDLPDVHSAMRMLYALSNGGYGNSEKQLSQILKRNQELLDKAEREQNQDSLAGLYALFLAPALTGAGKMMIDMTAFLVVFLASVHR